MTNFYLSTWEIFNPGPAFLNCTVYFWLASLCFMLRNICVRAHLHAHTYACIHTHFKWKPIKSMLCLLCSVSFFAFPPLLLHQFWGEKYFFKYPFRKGCSCRTVLKTEKELKEEQVTLLVQYPGLFLWTKPSEERGSCKGGITNPRSEAMATA